MTLKSPYTTQKGHGGYSAIAYKDGDLFVAEDPQGSLIEEGSAASVLQAAMNAGNHIFLAEETFDIGSTTLTQPDKSMAIRGTGEKSIIKGSADPLIDVTMNQSEYQFRMQDVGIHTTSTNKGVFIDDCNSRFPIVIHKVDFVPEDHSGTLLYIKGMATGHITCCSFRESDIATTAKAIYLTADVNAFSQELYISNCGFEQLNYGVHAHGASGDRAYLAGLHIANSFFGEVDNPLHFKCVDDVTIVGSTIDSPGTTGGKGMVFEDCISCRISANRIATKSTTGQIDFIGTDLDCYLNTVSTNFITSYGKVGDGILFDCSPGDKTVEGEANNNIIFNVISAIQATKGATFIPLITFNGNRLRACTNNIKGDIVQSIVLGNSWGAGCSSTAVNGSYGTSEIAHNIKT